MQPHLFPAFRCQLRLTGNDSQWQCMDNEHFNYIYCGTNTSLDRYVTTSFPPWKGTHGLSEDHLHTTVVTEREFRKSSRVLVA